MSSSGRLLPKGGELDSSISEHTALCESTVAGPDILPASECLATAEQPKAPFNFVMRQAGSGMTECVCKNRNGLIRRRFWVKSQPLFTRSGPRPAASGKIYAAAAENARTSTSVRIGLALLPWDLTR